MWIMRRLGMDAYDNMSLKFTKALESTQCWEDILA